MRCFLGDIRDKGRLMQAMEAVDIVIHPQFSPTPDNNVYLQGSCICEPLWSNQTNSRKVTISTNIQAGKPSTRISTVRYGNVIGTRSSVIPLFQKLRDEGVDELTITNSKMTRFLLTLQQSLDFFIDCTASM